VDIATLGLRIDGTQIVAAEAQLDKFSGAAQRAEKSTRAYQAAANDRISTSDIADAVAEYDRLHQTTASAHAEALKMNAAFDAQSGTVRRGTDGIGRLNNSLTVLARQATGTHPIVGQLADVVGTFAIGTAAMVPILAGIAAIAAGWRFMTRDAREAKETLEGALQVLKNIDKERATQREGGATQVTLNIVARELAKLQAEAEAMRQIVRAQPGTDAAVFAGARLSANQREQQALFEKALAGVAEREQELASERSEERRANLALRNRVNAATQAYSDLTEQIRALTEAANRQRAQVMGRVDEPMFLRALRGPDHRAVSGQNMLWAVPGPGDQSNQIEETAKRTLRTLERQRAAEEELERVRARANRALVRSLENVGRAYGGVADQILGIVAATLSLERVPMVSGGDKARGYGAAGLAGIGYGTSSGSAGIGALGGAASGFAIAGPTGAVVGGVDGIVSGLVESGKRAREAARVWDAAFRDFGRMFDDPSGLEASLRAISDQFDALQEQLFENAGAFADVKAASAGTREYEANRELIETRDRLIAQARELAEAEAQRFREDLDVRFLRAQGLEDEADALRRQIQQQREYEDAVKRGYDTATLAFLKEVQAAEAAEAAAERARQEWDRLLGVQNAPAGFDIRYYTEHYGGGWRPPTTGGGGPTDGDGVVVNGDVYIIDDDRAREPEDVRARVRRTLDLRKGLVR
jgi:hypothetical protein